ncbi:MAG TPA: 4Fe-4S dicluster domain-containing protein, partial [Casimicrobiaceae bacterium]|nr:4Fe-4S dicluster domain-containing protein [Casimicrobiaceae bacterium]
AQQTYGTPLFYASTLPRDGYGMGVLVECNMGRPTKIEGNPSHPASLGATDVFAQAAVLDLWDPDRSQAVREHGAISTWTAFDTALSARLRQIDARRGDGLRILTEATTSPSLSAQMHALLSRYPQAQWHRWQPLNRDRSYAGARLAYGRPYEAIYRFDLAKAVLTLDADFLDDMPGCVRYALDFSATRRADAPLAMRSRLYAIECTPTLTGANADHRMPMRASDIPLAAYAIAHALGVLPDGPTRPVVPETWMKALVDDLSQHRGASIVVAGERQPMHVHALAHLINERLGNVGSTVLLLPPIPAEAGEEAQSIATLAADMHAGKVELLLVSGANPVYTAPADLAFEQALRRVTFKAHHGLYLDETAHLCDWHLPASHALESWGDARAYDGTASLQQPCIAPLYRGRSLHEVIAAMSGAIDPDGHAIVTAFWREQHPGDFDAFLDATLRAGIVQGSAATPERPALRAGIAAELTHLAPGSTTWSDTNLELVFARDPRIGDGRHANNAWLQELPQPLTQLTWDNALLISAALAARLQMANLDVVEVRANGSVARAAVWITPGVPDGSVTLALGYGRTHAGNVAAGAGTDAYPLRTSTDLGHANGVSLARTGRRHALASTQTHSRMEGRDLVRSLSATQAAACTTQTCSDPSEREHRTLYASPPQGPYAWAMSIDLSACIGCGTCTIACQAENNIPVVGRDEVLNGREMHWIRVDRYYEGTVDNPHTVFQPVPCMQCEHAPCEVVCPVEASVHDAQGINVQVYNRCVGTRFCSNNCPYKVRRFNFLQYARDEPTLDAQRNPEVTVRMRGVMEKCNYCLQRITAAKIGADRDNRRLRDGEVVTACQAACPTRAIVFGDLNDPASEINRRRRSPLDYTLLAELNTRPRTTYLARVTHRAPQLGEG